MMWTPKLRIGSVIRTTVAVAAVGLLGWLSQVTPGTQSAIVTHETIPVISNIHLIPAIDVGTTYPRYYLPVTTWHGTKHWLKKNAPIVGGAGAGAVIGGIAGGGTGALIGGAAGGGAGYIYKRATHHHHYHHNSYYYSHH